MSDGISWYCPQCYTRKSIRQNSFFTKSRLPLQKWVFLIYFWVRQYPVTDAHEEAEVGEHTAIDIYQWLREVCSQKLLRGPPIVLGGPHTIVQIDESLFRHKPKVSSNFTIQKMVLVCICIIFECHIFTLIASSGQSNYTRSVGIRIGRHLSVSSTGLHGGCCQMRRSNLTANHQRPTQLQAQLFTLTNGRHTGVFRISRMFPITEL